MPYKLKSEIEWYQDGELATGTFTSTTPDGVANRPLEDLFDNIDFVRDDLATNYYTKTEVDSLVSGAIGGIATAHNDLTELQGGTTGEFFHLTSAQHTDLTGTSQASQNASISSNSSTISNHESRISSLESVNKLEKVVFYDAALINATAVSADNLVGQTITLPDSSTIGFYTSWFTLVSTEDIDVIEIYSQDFGSIKVFTSDLAALNPSSGSPWIIGYDDDFSNDHRLEMYFSGSNLIINSRDIAAPGGGSNSQHQIYRIMGYSVTVQS